MSNEWLAKYMESKVARQMKREGAVSQNVDSGKSSTSMDEVHSNLTGSIGKEGYSNAFGDQPAPWHDFKNWENTSTSANAGIYSSLWDPPSDVEVKQPPGYEGPPVAPADPLQEGYDSNKGRKGLMNSDFATLGKFGKLGGAAAGGALATYAIGKKMLDVPGGPSNTIDSGRVGGSQTDGSALASAVSLQTLAMQGFKSAPSATGKGAKFGKD